MKISWPIPYAPAFRLYHLAVRTVFRVLAPRIRATGRENIPYRGAVIFAPNHISDADPPLVGWAVRRPLYYMAKRELWDIPWLAPVISYLQAFPVDPSSPDRAALKHADQLLKQGAALVVFPEGKISHDGQLDEILPGAVLLALRSGAPVIPVGIAGAEKLIPYGTIYPRLTLRPLTLHFGKALHFDDLKSLPGRDARELAAERLRVAITLATAVAADGEAQPGTTWA